MVTNQEMVREFHERIRAHVGVDLAAYCGGASSEHLQDLAYDLQSDATGALQEFRETGDARELRVHLIAEEFSELATALAENDKVLLADALADLVYVAYGTAVTFGIPLDAVFAEVHRSNMTKEPQPDDPDAARVRDKGPNYSPPDVERVLREAGAL